MLIKTICRLFLSFALLPGTPIKGVAQKTENISVQQELLLEKDSIKNDMDVYWVSVSVIEKLRAEMNMKK